MDRKMKHKRVRYAFTLIELMVVIVILAIAAAVVVPLTSSAGTMQLRSAANVVAADLEYAKSMAISRGTIYGVVFDPGAESYQIVDSAGQVIDHPVRKGFKYVVDFGSEGRLDRVDIVSANFDGGNTVRFNYLGSPLNSSGDLNSGVITLQVGPSSKTIRVEPVTGYITVSN
jgi:prepilin-type N-terminal cleavage/methylation domain-containing protein